MFGNWKLLLSKTSHGSLVTIMGFLKEININHFQDQKDIYLCFRLKDWRCERYCEDIPTMEQSVVAMAGDTIVSATCLRALNNRTGEEIWRVEQEPGSLLLASCTSLEVDQERNLVQGYDCVNGTTLPASMFSHKTNLTRLMKLFTV